MPVRIIDKVLLPDIKYSALQFKGPSYVIPLKVSTWCKKVKVEVKLILFTICELNVVFIVSVYKWISELPERTNQGRTKVVIGKLVFDVPHTMSVDT